MARDRIKKLGILLITVLLVANLVVSVRSQAAAQGSEAAPAIR